MCNHRVSQGIIDINAQWLIRIAVRASVAPPGGGFGGPCDRVGMEYQQELPLFFLSGFVAKSHSLTKVIGTVVGVLRSSNR